MFPFHNFLPLRVDQTIPSIHNICLLKKFHNPLKETFNNVEIKLGVEAKLRFWYLTSV